MKKMIATILALSLATPAFAECDKTGIAGLFDERADGTNCPATQGEKVVGNAMIFATVVFIVAAASGKINFPLVK